MFFFSCSGKLSPVPLFSTCPTEWTGKIVKFPRMRKRRWPPLLERNLNLTTSTWARIEMKIWKRKTLCHNCVSLPVIILWSRFTEIVFRRKTFQLNIQYAHHCSLISREIPGIIRRLHEHLWWKYNKNSNVLAMCLVSVKDTYFESSLSKSWVSLSN